MMRVMADLFETLPAATSVLADGLILLTGFADRASLLPEIDKITAAATFRRMETRGGRRMSVAMSNCGARGWVSDRDGYRYSSTDPLTGLAWPAMPAVFHDLATRAATRAGFVGFDPDVCLINRYEPGAKMGAHQDKDENDFSQPIVSVSLGLPARFLFYGERRSGGPATIELHDGDVLVMGGHARRAYHGVRRLAAGDGPLGSVRINLTFRRAA